jgi:hypothetical protein
MKLVRRLLLLLALLLFVPLGVAVTRHLADDTRATDWRSASHAPAGLAPDPAHTPEAVIQVYAAKAFGWRGAFGVHTWIAAKPAGARQFTRFEVVGWGVARGRDAVRVGPGAADGRWYGSMPTLLRELRGGAEVDALIERLHAAAQAYPHHHEYQVWPGPNSNTFIAYLGRAVPGLGLELPPNAVGKDYLPDGGWVATAPSGGGFQFSARGLLGLTVAPAEGLELNVLGLTLGFDPSPPAIKLPGAGRIGAAQTPG